MPDENSIIENVKLATKAIRFYLSKRVLGDISLIKYFNELTRGYIGSAIELWAGHTYVGVPKQRQIQDAFQEFYIELMRLLLVIQDGSMKATEEELSFANSLLYRGTIYRYLGNGNPCKKIRKPIEPKYDEIYVSWSTKEELTPYMDTKFYGVKTLLEANITKDYGINLEYFNLIQQENENEIVYPTNKESIVGVKHIK